MSNRNGQFSVSYMARHMSSHEDGVYRAKGRGKQVARNRRTDAFEAEFNPKLQAEPTTTHHHFTSHQPQAVLMKTMRNGKKVFTVKR
ncbi:MAG TPA: hypothetical protein VN081_04910 [Dongiaceae bacterium]|nr:hypothetical protein [Dongiaceae bacterium]